MGIQGLLPLLKSIQKPTHLRNFAGQTIGVDAYGWLHRGTVACAIDLAEGKPTRKHIDFTLHRVRMLIHFGIKPYLVFDGDYLPSKAHTERERAARRKESKRIGLEMLRTGRMSQAQLELQKAIDVTPVMARELIEELKRLDVAYLVAPYEADSQLAFLEKQGTIQGVLSEDSDLLVFGVKCLLTKLDQYGECIMINRADFTSCRDISLVGWSDKEFRAMAMLSGCDYLPGIEKMGLKTAYRLVRKHKSVERVVRTVQFDGKMKIPPGYLEAFYNAERTFLHQWIFCPETRCLRHLNPLPAGLDASAMPYIGKYVEADLAIGVAQGDLDPNSKTPIPMPNRFQHRAITTRTVTTPSEKQGIPITQFFKKRTPLAELDPNSFTPSPSQTRLLRQHVDTSWSASQAPVPRTFGSSRDINASGPSSVPHHSRRSITNPLSSGQRTQPKRQRLCSEPGMTSRMKDYGLESAKSCFFEDAPVHPSPSVRGTSARCKEEEFQLWSDDSTAEALAAVSACTEVTNNNSILSPRKRKSMNIFLDAPPVAEDMDAGDVSQASVLTVATDSSRESPAVDTPDTSFASIDTTPDPNASRQPEEPRPAMSRFGMSSFRKRNPRLKSHSLFANTPLLVRQRSQLPAPVDWSAETTSDSSLIAVPNSSPSQDVQDTNGGCNDDSNDDNDLELEKQAARQLLHLDAKGSEDFLVPQSPEDVVNEHRAISGLDLSKFAFSG